MTEETDKIKIRLHIYDTDINVTVPREEEALYRRDADLINERLNTYYGQFKRFKSDKEITYFAMIDIGLRLQKLIQRNDTEPYNDLLQQLTSEIEEVIGCGEENKLTGK
jgi:cell division protein ZapA